MKPTVIIMWVGVALLMYFTYLLLTVDTESSNAQIVTPCGTTEMEFVALNTTPNGNYVFSTNGTDIEVHGVKLPINGIIIFDSCTFHLSSIKIGDAPAVVFE